MPSFPTIMVHANKSDGGLQLPSLTELTFLAKWSMFLQGLYSIDPTTQKATTKQIVLTIHQCPIPMAENMRIIVPAPEREKQHKPLCTDLLTGHAASKGIHLCKMGTTPATLMDQLHPQKLAAALGVDVKASNNRYPFKTYGDLLRFKKGVGSEPEWAINHIPENGREKLRAKQPPPYLTQLTPAE